MAKRKKVPLNEVVVVPLVWSVGVILLGTGLALLNGGLWRAQQNPYWWMVMVVVVVWWWVLVPLVRFMDMAQRLYDLADVADERGEGVPAELVALAVEGATGMNPRVRRTRWKADRLAREEESSG